jgi:hypothetical protein
VLPGAGRCPDCAPRARGARPPQPARARGGRGLPAGRRLAARLLRRRGRGHVGVPVLHGAASRARRRSPGRALLPSGRGRGRGEPGADVLQRLRALARLPGRRPWRRMDGRWAAVCARVYTFVLAVRLAGSVSGLLSRVTPNGVNGRAVQFLMVYLA